MMFGYFEKTSQKGIAILTFTQQEILAGNIKFIPYGSTNKPAYEVKVSDGFCETDWEAANIKFHKKSPAGVWIGVGIGAAAVVLCLTAGTTAIEADAKSTPLFNAMNI